MTMHQLDSLLFQLNTIGDLPRLLASETYAHLDDDTVQMMLEQAARFSEEHLTPLAASGDIAGCRLEQGAVTLPPGTAETYQSWCELGFPLLSLPLENDGMQFPLVLQCAVQDLMDGTNLAFGMMAINLRCATLTLLRHAPDDLLQEWLPQLVSGEAASTIVISEPQAGSDAGRIRTRAQPGENGSWKVSGSKIWISFADHDATGNILHLVLARVPGDETGTRGLGLFAVPKLIDGETNGVAVTRLEEKMGLHASPTCVVEFTGARATLIGEPTDGIRNLFSMMNAMRLAVGVQGAATACAATAQAVAYARERPQGGRPDQPPVMISEHADVQRMLLGMTAVAELLRGLALRTASFLDLDSLSDQPGESRWKAMAELLLPLSKTLGAELGCDTVNTGIQVLGGYGYTRDYPLERMARDLRVASIYEGTSGIQALDLVKRKILGDQGNTLELLLEHIDADLRNAGSGNPLTEGVLSGVKAVNTLLAWLLDLASADRKAIEPACYPTLRLIGLLCLAWNGVVLYDAASGDSAHARRLRAALTHFAGGLEQELALWLARAMTPLPASPFRDA